MLRTTLLKAFSAALVSVLTVNVAWAETADATIAETLFREGQDLMQRGRVAEACAKFQASQTAQPALGTLLNLAVCHEREGKTASAWTEFSEVQATAARTQDEKRRAYAETHLKQLANKLSKVEIHVVEPTPELRITLDGRVLPSAAWSSLIPVDPGEHTLEASAPGFRTFSEKRQFEAKAGTTAWQVPTLEALPKEPEPQITPPPLSNATPAPAPLESAPVSTPGAPSPAPATSDDRATRRALAWMSGGFGVVGLGLGVALELAAQSYAKDRDELCPPDRGCTTVSEYNRAKDAHDDAKRSQVLGFVSGGVGLAALGAAGYLFWSSRSDAQSVSVHVTPVVGPSVNGLFASGKF
ncbi:MAG TPA: hypothetical protein VFQ35_05325 [Polyangiaceae bacterium]|nr:hypothetical protein [Polyangiaceae bacterium]